MQRKKRNINKSPKSGLRVPPGQEEGSKGVLVGSIKGI